MFLCDYVVQILKLGQNFLSTIMPTYSNSRLRNTKRKMKQAHFITQ